MTSDVVSSEASTTPSLQRPGEGSDRSHSCRETKSAAAILFPLLGALFRDGIPVRFEFWDRSTLGPKDGPGKVVVRRDPEPLMVAR